MNLKIVCINGSPRPNSNTLLMLTYSCIGAENITKYTKSVAIETEIINLTDYDIDDCLACKSCKCRCIRQDEELESVFNKMIDADGLIFGSPVYFGTVTGLMKRFLDRTRILRHNDFQLMDKPVGFVAVAARRNGGQETTILEMAMVMLRHGCVIVNNGPPTSQYGATGWASHPGDIEYDLWGLDTAIGVGRRVAMTSLLMKVGYQSEHIDYTKYRENHPFSSTSGTKISGAHK